MATPHEPPRTLRVPPPGEIEGFAAPHRLALVALLAGGVGAAFVALGFIFTPDQMLYSYLTNFVYCFGLSFGALAWLMAFFAASSRWVVVVRRPFEMLSSLMPLWALLFVPILVGMKRLYPWVAPDPRRGDHFIITVRHQLQYLNVSGFIARSCVYFLLFIALSQLLLRGSLQQDAVPETERTLRLSLRSRWISSLGLPVIGVAITFAGFDWLMSLDPTFRSTIYSLYYFAGAFVGAMALAIVFVSLVDRAGLTLGLVNVDHYHNLGKLLFAFTCFWGYIAFAQYMLIWIANLPESEVPFFLLRQRQGWGAVSLFLVAGHFFVPFIVLLSANLKKSPATLAPIAGWILFAHWVDSNWLVMPFHDASPIFHWQDLAAFVALAGLGTAFFIFRHRGRPIFPVGDPYFEDSALFHQ